MDAFSVTIYSRSLQIVLSNVWAIFQDVNNFSNFEQPKQRSHNLGKFPQIFPVFMGVVLGIMRILCIPFKILLFG